MSLAIKPILAQAVAIAVNEGIKLLDQRLEELVSHRKTLARNRGSNARGEKRKLGIRH